MISQWPDESCRKQNAIDPYCIHDLEGLLQKQKDAESRSRILLKGIEYNSSTKGKWASDTNEIVSTNCESEKWDTEVEKDKKVSFDNVTNAG